MKNGSMEEDAPGGQSGTGKRPHWRLREHTATAVYVVHPTQFRTVVQQLTGAASASPPPLSTHQHAGGANGAGTRTNAAAVQAQHGEGEQSGGSSSSSSRGRTLGQMYQDCLAWANADDS